MKQDTGEAISKSPIQLELAKKPSQETMCLLGSNIRDVTSPNFCSGYKRSAAQFFKIIFTHWINL